MAETDYYATRV